MKYQPPFEPSFAGPVDGVYNSNPDAPYVNGNPATGQEGSIPPMEALAHPMRELVHLIEHSGQTPTHEDLEQVRKAIKKMIEDGTRSTSTEGSAVAIWQGLQDGTGIHNIRALLPGTNIEIDLVEQPSGSGEYQIRISAIGSGGSGEGGPLVNIGDGAQVYKGFNDPNEELRTIKGINGITCTQDANTVVIDGKALLNWPPKISRVKFNTPGAYSWTVPENVRRVRVRAWGAGGGGGYTTGGAPAGGGGGAYVEKDLDVTAGTTISGSIGAGGAGGAASPAQNGLNGGSTTIIYDSVVYTAGGGPGGLNRSVGNGNSPGSGVPSGPFDIGLTGEQGGIGLIVHGGVRIGGKGGGSPFGGTACEGGEGLPTAGSVPGGGGGGSGNPSFAGGIGARGEVWIEYTV